MLVVGSALFLKGRDMGREIRLIRALADEGYQYALNDGVPPIPRDRMVAFASLPKHLAKRLMDEIEAGGVPVVMLRGDGQINPDGVRDYDLLCRRASRRRASSGTPTARVARARGRGLARGRDRASTASIRRPPAVRALLQRTTGARVRVDGEVVGRIGPGLVVLLGVGPDDTEAIGRRAGATRAELRIFRDDDGPDRPVAARRRRCGARRLAVHPLRRHAARSPAGLHRRGAAGASPSALRALRGRRCARSASRSRPGRFGAEMAVELVNDGPFTIWLDTADR